MNQSQALRAVELIGGYRKTASMVRNLNGEPMHEGNLKKAIKNVRGVPEWLATQLYWAVANHLVDVQEWVVAIDMADGLGKAEVAVRLNCWGQMYERGI